MKWRESIKYVLVVFLLIFLVVVHQLNTTKMVSMKEAQKVIQPQKTASTLKKGTDSDLRRYYGVEPSDIKDYLLYIPSEMMSVEELLIVEAKDKDDVSAIRADVEARLQSQKKSFESYGTNQMSLLNRAVVYTRGKYIFFAVSKQAGTWEHKFKELL